MTSVGTDPNAEILNSLRTKVLDESEPVAGLLRACLAVAYATESEDLKKWANQELKGYEDAESVPDYRRMALPLYADSISGYNVVKFQSISRLQVPQALRDYVPQVFAFRQTISELERLATQDQDTIRLTIDRFPAIAAMWTKNHMESPFQQITDLYYAIGKGSIAGLVDTVRTTVVELVMEIASGVPFNELPSKQKVDAAVQISIGSSDTYNVAANDNSGNVAVGSGATQYQENGPNLDALAPLFEKLTLGVQESDADAREALENALADLKAEATAENPDIEQVGKKLGIFKKLAQAFGNATLQAAASEAGQQIGEALGTVF